MKTEQLIDLLASDSGAVRGRPVTRRLGLAVAVGVPATLAACVVWLGLRPDLAAVMLTPAMWVKLAFVLSTTGLGLLAATRLSRPGVTAGVAVWGLAAVFAVMWLWAGLQLSGATPEGRVDLLMGRTWRQCPFRIATLSVPMLLAALLAMRSLAPTRLRAAGAAAGLLAGGAAASVYALHCPEMAAPFIGLWYALGMLIPTVVGALVGPRVLRW